MLDAIPTSPPSHQLGPVTNQAVAVCYAPATHLPYASAHLACLGLEAPPRFPAPTSSCTQPESPSRTFLRLLLLEDESYRTYVESHPKAKDLVNKPIPYYDDLWIVSSDDHATGEFTRSIFDWFVSDEANTEGNNEPSTEFVEPEAELELLEPNDQQRELPRHTSSTITTRGGHASRSL
ncbi:hypothetical protein J5N97_020618 [Dioscorea zingiberensis]|uniref:Uncharacterized protein n=1 Tax=Dioscorea zingiberensis TaxID=325984 RepID=A0A9D5CGY1_9LILI|nr:hypothetical protein J5N97_020618 [Dioscorea zingiberensis]